jgi:nucleotide-binding universal stress UspA family protein
MKLLLALDGSPCSEAAIRFVATQMTPAGMEVRILRAVDVFPTLPLCYAYSPARGMEKLERHQLTQAQEFVTQAAYRLRAAGFDVSALVQVGEPRNRILEEAAAWKADVIVMGSHGRKGADLFFFGSVSQAVARHATCSVEIVRIPRSGRSYTAEPDLAVTRV